jgi:uncharacterized protein (TIGR03435 family)
MVNSFNRKREFARGQRACDTGKAGHAANGHRERFFDYDIRQWGRRSRRLPSPPCVSVILVDIKITATFLCALLIASTCPAQSPEKFEVASVRLRPGSTGLANIGPYDGATFTATNAPLLPLIELAFGVDPIQISGEDRLGAERYDISAKPESGKLSYERLKPMLQSLFAERFGLQTHRETKDFQGYALTVAKGGPRLHTSGDTRPFQIYPGGLEAAPVTLDTFASMLTGPAGRPVVNKTAIQGTYDIRLTYAAEGDTKTSRPSIFTALQEQLGLRLEPQKVSLEMLVIDHCERVPTEN